MIFPSNDVTADAQPPDNARLAEATAAFQAALETGVHPDRDAFLAAYPDIADQLAQAIDSLLFLQQATHELPIGEEAAPATGLLEGQPLGDFSLRREIGRGGMGIVYEAEQLSLGRRVALKILPFAAALDAQQLRRFKTEAQAAAQLHHTHIVPVYAVGSERGVHFYAMQFIAGRPLASLIRELAEHESPPAGRPFGPACPPGRAEPASDLAPAATDSAPGRAESTLAESSRDPQFFRLAAQLGIQAARALDYAHKQGIIHRDIKPANLLVESHSNLWITDFGLARMQGEANATLTGDVLGTLRYMSPEQALGHRDRINHQTDIYSLGVSLYELLTLRPAIEGLDRAEILHQIANEEIRLPSRLNPAIPPELDTIILKAAAKAPEDRYATAGELADDLQRFLNDQPIRARRPTLWQRAQKFRRRHRRILTATSAALVVGLIVGLAGMAWVYIQAYRQERERRVLIADFIDQVFAPVSDQSLRAADPYVFQREQLKKAATYWETQRKRAPADPFLRHESAKAQLRLTKASHLLGEEAPTREAYTLAGELLEGLVHDFPRSVAYRFDLANFYMANPATSAKDAEDHFRHALPLFESLANEVPTDPHFRAMVVINKLAIGNSLRNQNRLQEGEPFLTKAVGESEELVARFPERPEYGRIRCDALEALSALAQMQADLPLGCQLMELALAGRRKLTEIFLDHPEDSLARARDANTLAQLQMQEGHLQPAVSLIEESIRCVRPLRDAHKSVAAYRAVLVTSYWHLAEGCWGQGQEAKGDAAWATARGLAEEDLPKAADRGAIRLTLAWLLLYSRRPNREDASRAIKLEQEVQQLENDQSQTRSPLLGVAHYQMGNYPEAVRMLKECCEQPQENRLQFEFFLASALAKTGAKAEARKTYDSAVAAMNQGFPGNPTLWRLRHEAEAVLGIALTARK